MCDATPALCPPSSVADDRASVDPHNRASDETGPGAAQERHHIGQLRGPAEPSHWYRRLMAGPAPPPQLCPRPQHGQLGREPANRCRTGRARPRSPAPRVPTRWPASEPRRPPRCGTPPTGPARGGLHHRPGGYVHQTPVTAGAQMPDRGPATRPARAVASLIGSHLVVSGHLGHAARCAAAGVDHADVEAAETGRGLVHHAGRLADDGQIPDDGDRAGSDAAISAATSARRPEIATSAPSAASASAVARPSPEVEPNTIARRPCSPRSTGSKLAATLRTLRIGEGVIQSGLPRRRSRLGGA